MRAWCARCYRPFYLPWMRMGNLHGWDGPLPQTWIDRQFRLQQRVVARMVGLGMQPVLPCFAGHVPRALRKVFPNASITRLPCFAGMNKTFTCEDLLSPTDPLFQRIATLLMRAQIKAYGGGVTRMFACDTYNEMRPATTNPAVLAASSRAVTEGIRAVVPNGVWVMQGWLFTDTIFWNSTTVKSYLSGVQPHDAMLILDLVAEDQCFAAVYDGYYGKPWVWTMIHNSGGVRNMYGDLYQLSEGDYGPVRYLPGYTPSTYQSGAVADIGSYSHTAAASTMAGIGYAPEAIEENPAIYELLLEWSYWANSTFSMGAWTDEYVRRRYGLPDTHIEAPLASPLQQPGTRTATSSARRETAGHSAPRASSQAAGTHAARAWRILSSRASGGLYACLDRSCGHGKNLPHLITLKPSLNMGANGCAYADGGSVGACALFNASAAVEAWGLLLDAARKSQIITLKVFYFFIFKMAPKRDVRCVFSVLIPGRLGAGCKTGLGSKINKNLTHVMLNRSIQANNRAGSGTTDGFRYDLVDLVCVARAFFNFF